MLVFFQVIKMKLDFDYKKNFMYFYGILLKSYKTFSSSALEDFDLSPIEIEVIKFLINNGSYFNTAKDITRYKGVSKGLVSKGVNSLINKGLLISKVNQEDKRLTNLYITNKAQPIVEKLNITNEEFRNMILKDISPSEIKMLEKIHGKIMDNLDNFKE